jgi:DNA-binding MarR family transcriptional regulator
MNPFETFTDEDITERLSVPMIIDAFWANEYGSEVPLITREVGCSLMYLVRKYGPIIPHDLLLQAVHEHTELSKSTVAPFIPNAVDMNMITVVTPDADERQRLYGFVKSQKSKILRASKAPAYAAALAMEQAKNPTDTEHGKTAANAPYYRHIFNRINTINEVIVKKLEKPKKRLGWVIVAALSASIVAGAGSAYERRDQQSSVIAAGAGSSYERRDRLNAAIVAAAQSYNERRDRQSNSTPCIACFQVASWSTGHT